MMKLGIDFGTSYTKIAYPDQNLQPRLFRYPNELSGQSYISTEISYIPRKRGISRFVGNQAFQHINAAPDVQFYQNFRKYLPLDSTQLPKNGWRGGHTPVSVTQDYFDELLTNGRYSFVQKMGKFEQVLISVPERWYRDQANPGPDRLLDTLEKLGIPRENLQLQSEPVCAAAYYAYHNEQRSVHEKNYNLLVCDMGGGTFDVALCKVVENNYIRVLHSDGSEEYESGLAGIAFDRACVQAACLDAFDKVPDHPNDFYRLQRAFEETRINPKIVDVTPQMVDQNTPPDSPDLISEENAQDLHFAGTTAYSFDNYSYQLKVSQIWQAFLPIRNEIHNVIQRVREVCSQNNWKIDRAVLVGGFGQYHLVQDEVFDYLPEINAEESTSVIPKDERYCAIAKGAFYIINGMVKVVKPSRYPLGIIVHGVVDGLLRRMEIPIIQGNQAWACMTTVRFATNENGERLIIHVKKQRDEPIPVYVQLNSQGPSRMMKPPGWKEWPHPGDYWVGFQFDRWNRVTLIFERCDSTKQYAYTLEASDFEGIGVSLYD